jgi:ATP-binding cassette subfamily F protein 3
MLGQLSPLGGEVQLGASLTIGYFAQAHDTLDPAHTVIEELTRHKEMDAEPARKHLAQYLFQEDDVFKPVSALSGGERARLALAILALDGANFLVLDEPTNHLDIPAQEALQEVLEDFTGTILLVSHDRYLIDRLATQIWELRNNRLQVFKGSYREFVLRKAATSGLARRVRAPVIARPLIRLDGREARKKAEALALVEGRIHDKESEVQRLYSAIQQASEKQDFLQAGRLGQQLAQAQATLESLMVDWEKLSV